MLRDTLKKKFGDYGETGYNDTFGHERFAAYDFTESGMENYVCMRPTPHQTGFRLAFYWESADGSKVRVFRVPITVSYGFKLYGKTSGMLMAGCIWLEGKLMPASSAKSWAATSTT